MIFGRLFKASPPPTTSASNPGRALEFRGKDEHGTEFVVQSVRLLAEILRAAGYSVKEHASWLELDSELLLLPRIVEVIKIEKGWHTVTTVEARHRHQFPEGLFEFQHAAADTMAEGFRQGFEQFTALDLPVLHELVTGRFKSCSRVVLKDRVATSPLPRPRRVVLGPVNWLVTDAGAAKAEQHPFCPCCFFTHNIEAMKEKLCAEGVFGVRFYAARFKTGELEADCRANGVDWPEGKAALLAYAATWPDCGFEVRKQYILIQDLK